MAIMSHLKGRGRVEPSSNGPSNGVAHQKVTAIACFLGLVASIGGFMFGYVSGQISGFFLMDNYAERFGEEQSDGSFTFSAARQGTIVGLLCVGCLIGSLISGSMSDIIGRRLTISSSALFTMIGTIIEISSEKQWAQFAVGLVVPMYQSESSPAIIRGILLFITLGIWTADMVNWGTELNESSASWRVPNGLSFLWALILGGGILLLPESPRYAYRKGRVEEARNTIARLAGVAPDDYSVSKQIDEIRAKQEEEKAGTDTKWYEIFTGPRMLYRTLLGMTLQIILGSVNVACTFGGLWVVAKCGRRKALMIGGLWMMMCFFVYAFVGHFSLDHENPMNTPRAGTVLIAFSCLFIAAFAYRGRCMALATAANWFWNSMISFFTRFITDAIDYLYGLVFAGCCAALVLIVFFFLIASKDRTLEEIDTMYVEHVNPIKSSSCVANNREKDGSDHTGNNTESEAVEHSS
ncbi:hypothetical protein BGZ61DRAFT_467381 [Ilyonectria robusta]|uniref:uncharacterized protein n=1 Tax=Ilyonectria robusta TaxID=1079257 RepID=UPI001E8DF85E|nr:uncharacterized protein BGZ61DRAFT_467381 [Ilyonectria robusta]KAH8654758.1 hypothetical protein BGZ61DRAFT_467381 [Ilyonectria robusta]